MFGTIDLSDDVGTWQGKHFPCLHLLSYIVFSSMYVCVSLYLFLYEYACMMCVCMWEVCFQALTLSMKNLYVVTVFCC